MTPTQHPHLRLINVQTPEYDHSPELELLRRQIAYNARQVFDSVVESIQPCADTTADYVLIIDQRNVYIAEDSLRAMKDMIDSGSSIVVPSPITAFDLPETPYTLGQYWEAEAYCLKSQPQSKPKSHLPIVLMRQDVFLTLVEQVGIEGFMTQGQLLEDYGLTYQTAGLYYEYIDYYGVTRKESISFIPKNAASILDVGCARGYTGSYLKQQLGCRVVGVELNPIVAADAVQRLDHVVQGDYLSAAISETFDVILANDLFEHLQHPEAILQKSMSLLNEQGQIVISTPNIGHYSVIEGLLQGRWDYLPMGILCTTHVRFFTKKSLSDWLLMLGITSFDIFPQKTDLPKRFRKLPNWVRADYDSLRTSGFYVVIPYQSF